MTTQHWVLHLEPIGRCSWIECDGERLDNARAVWVHASVDGMTSIEVEFVNVRVDIDAETEDVTDDDIA